MKYNDFFQVLLARVIECLPYPIQIYAPDGTSVLVNKAMLAEYHAISPDMVSGNTMYLKILMSSQKVGSMR